MVASTAVIRHRVPLSPPDRKSVVNGSMTWDGAHGQASGLGERLLTVDDAVGGPVLNRVAPEVAHDGGISGLSPSRMRASPPRIPLKIAGIFTLQPVIPSRNVLNESAGITSACGFVSSPARNPHAPARHPHTAHPHKTPCKTKGDRGVRAQWK